MNPPAFRWLPGHKVICIDARFTPEVLPCFTSLPVRGQIYTPERIGRGYHWKSGAPCLNARLLECPSISNANGAHAAFLLKRFRPLADQFARHALSQQRKIPLRRGRCPPTPATRIPVS